ncbi:MAG: DUF4832 domain-containing protein [Planctomycetes bacterium]|nr:DUF4832 domain-containing protein [Planctomycetota bacterium]
MNTLAMAAFAGLLAAPAAQTIEYHGIRPADPGGRMGLRNPERGWRIETLFAEPAGAPVWGPAHHLKDRLTQTYEDAWWILDAARYEPEGLTLAQMYCYLDGYIETPIDARKLALLDAGLDEVRRRGLKAVLRFAYEKDTHRRGGPDLARILAHIDQLKPIIRKHADVILVLQAGFVGAWGEWHSSTRGIEKDHAALGAIVAKVLDALPSDRMTQVRVPKYKRWVIEQPGLAALAPRIGFHDDGFLAGTTDGGTWPEGPRFANPGNPEFDVMTRQSPFVLVDGELFWSDQGGAIDGIRAAARLMLHHYTSFSIAHSYSEREGKPYSIDAWIRQPLTIECAREAKLSISDGYFDDGAGAPVARTAYEYIRDHLGHRLELARAGFAARIRAGEEASFAIELVNRGFSAIHNPRPVFIALISPDGRVAVFRGEDVDPRAWQPHAPGDEDAKPLLHRFQVRARIPEDLDPAGYLVGLWLPDGYESLRMDPRYAIRVANRDVPWWTDREGRYGINVLGRIEIAREGP